MSKEIRLGLFTILILAAGIWGYKYLMGKNLLSSAYHFKTTLSDVSQLDVSAPVLINGLKVGSITKIELNKNNLQEMIIHFLVDGEYQIPKDATALIVTEGVMGGKVLSLKYSKLCNGENCAEDGDVFKSKDVGLIGSMLGNEDVDSYIASLSTEVNKIVEGIGAEDGKGALNATVRELEVAIKNISQLSYNTNRLIANSYNSLNKTLINMSAITENLASNNSKISEMLSNMSVVSEDLKKAKIGENLTSTTSSLNESTVQLKKTLETTDQAMSNLSKVLAKANDGDGSLSKLLNDRTLYDNLEKTSSNLSLLLQDLRLNPKRYVNVSVFGKKGKEYTKPENDPAYENED